MRRYYLRNHFIVGVTSFFLSLPAYTSTPAWVFSAPMPATVSVGADETGIVRYTITNQSRKPKNLYLKSTAGLRASPCRLAGKGSTCTLTLRVDGSRIPAQGIHSGPILCEQGNANQCYQPSANHLLHITTGSSLIKYSLAVGVYTDLQGVAHALSYLSKDKGISWRNSSPLPSIQGSRNSGLSSVFCGSKGQCAAVGAYTNGGSNIPLSYVSSDYGLHWTLSTTLPPTQGTNGNTLSNVSCDSSGHCVAVGVYDDDSDPLPLSYVSSDFGAHWSLSLPPVLPGTINAELRGVSCVSAARCAAVGVAAYGSGRAPLIYFSNTYGVHWDFSTNMPPVLGIEGDQLNSISCDLNGRCVVVGFSITVNDSVPLSYVSTDYGVTWVFSSTLPPPHQSNDSLSGVSCVPDGHCAAVGVYKNTNISFPLSYVSTDYGVNWSLSTTLPPSQGNFNHILNGVSCDATGHCIAVGYSDEGILSYVSSDYGVNWSLSTVLPMPGTESAFLGASVS